MTPTAQQHRFGGNTQQQEADNATYDATVEKFARVHTATQGQAELMTNTIQQQQQTIPNMQQQMNMANSMPFQQPMQFQQSMQYQQQQSQGRGRHDRVRGGRGGNWQQQTWGQMQQQPDTYQMNTNFNGSQSGGGGNQQTEQNPYRRYENDGFCGTHGGHVHDGHNSQACTKPGPNHNSHTI